MEHMELTRKEKVTKVNLNASDLEWEALLAGLELEVQELSSALNECLENNGISSEISGLSRQIQATQAAKFKIATRT